MYMYGHQNWRSIYAFLFTILLVTKWKHGFMHTYTDALDITGDHASNEGRRVAHRDAAVVEHAEVVAAGANNEHGPGQQVVQPPTAHQVGPDDSVLRLVEQLDLLAQADRLVPLQAWTCLDSFLFVGTTEEA
jgi:hypothetical protein